MHIALMTPVYDLAISYYLIWRRQLVFTNYMLQIPCHTLFIRAK